MDELIVWPLYQFLIDGALLLAVALPVPFIVRKRVVLNTGFYCDDKDIMYPFLGGSVVKNRHLHSIGCVLNIVSIILIEFLNRKPTDKFVQLWCLKIPRWIYDTYQTLLHFAVGILSTILVCKVLKGSVERLRPYFLDVCRPSVNCSLPENKNVYHMNYECTSNQHILRIASSKFSFPSGHSAFAAYCAIFFAIYIERRVKWSATHLVKDLLAICVITAGAYVGITQLTTFKHFPSDVWVGYLIGGCFAAFFSLKPIRSS